MAIQNASILSFSTTKTFSNLTNITILCTTNSIVVTSSSNVGAGVTLTSGQSLSLESSDGFTLPAITITIVASGVYGVVFS
jgi:hypothetical protein